MTGFLGKIKELDAVKDAEVAWWQAQPISVRSTATFELVRAHHLLLENIYIYEQPLDRTFGGLQRC